LPTHKNVILGVVTSKFANLEDKEEMKIGVDVQLLEELDSDSVIAALGEVATADKVTTA
jgi:hypothetical protein